MAKVTLSAQVCQAAACKEGSAKTDYYDTAITGFILTVSTSGSKVFSLRYRDQYGKQRQHKIGDAKSITFDKARLQAQKLRSKVVLGENPADEKQALRKVSTLGEFVQDIYLGHIKATRRNYDADLSFMKHHLLPRFGSLHLDQITSDLIADAHRDLRAKNYAPATCNKLPVILKIIYNLARKRKLTGAEFNPAAEVKLFEPNNIRERYLSKEEIQRLRGVLLESENPQLKFIVPLLILLSCRKRELLDSKWSDFDLERRNWRIPMSKNGKPRNVPLSSAVLEILNGLPRFENCPYVVPNPSTKKPFVSFYASWDAARKKAGLADVTVHMLRHTGASQLLKAGASIYTVSRVLGHANLRTTQRYAHIADDALLAAVDAQAIEIGATWEEPQREAA